MKKLRAWTKVTPLIIPDFNPEAFKMSIPLPTKEQKNEPQTIDLDKPAGKDKPHKTRRGETPELF